MSGASPQAQAESAVIMLPNGEPTFDDGAGPPVPPAWNQVPQGRDPIPDAAAREQAGAQLREDLKERLAAGGTQDRSAIAKELLQAASVPVDDAHQRFAKLVLARQLAGEAADYATCLHACEELGRLFAVDTVRMTAAALSKYAVSAQTDPDREALARACIGVGFGTIAVDDYRFVLTLGKLADSTARSARLPHLVQQAAFMLDEGRDGYAAAEAVRATAQRLLESEGDAEANLAVGQFLCFVKSDWERGLPMLARGAASEASAAAEQELTGPEETGAQIALGDRWWEMGERSKRPEKLQYRSRARHWYLKGLASANANERTSLRAKLQPRLESVPARAFTMRLGVSGVDYHVLRISQEGIRSVANQHGGLPEFTLNHLSWRADLRHGIANAGATRLFPDEIDFTSVDVEIVGRRCRYGTAYGELGYRVAEDHVLLDFRHWPIGGCERFDVLLTFREGTPTKDRSLSPDRAEPSSAARQRMHQRHTADWRPRAGFAIEGAIADPSSSHLPSTATAIWKHSAKAFCNSGSRS